MIGAYYDVVVIGGGINGVGVAQAAAAGGYSVLLIEKNSLAAGTSSRSSKLIHGGLRYLESWEFGLVRESLKERALLRRLAPDLVRLRDFHIPVYRETRRRPDMVRIAETRYLCSALRHYFTTWMDLRSDQVESAFAGVRVLPAEGGHLFHRSRETVLQADRPTADGPPRVLSIYGGKLTTYRTTAAKVIEQIRPGLPARREVADTAKLALELP